jgi:hypothetical protein
VFILFAMAKALSNPNDMFSWISFVASLLPLSYVVKTRIVLNGDRLTVDLGYARSVDIRRISAIRRSRSFASRVIELISAGKPVAIIPSFFEPNDLGHLVDYVLKKNTTVSLDEYVRKLAATSETIERRPLE